MDFGPNFVDATIRFAHVTAGIIWLGILYYLQFAQAPALARLGESDRHAVLRAVMPKTLCWFRWSATATLILGLFLFHWVYMSQGQMRQAGTDEITGRALYVMIAMTIAIVMWLNVWVLVWPGYKRILAALEAGKAPPTGARARFGSTFNLYASAPMLMLMVMGPHYGSFHWGMVGLVTAAGLVLVFALSFLARSCGAKG